MVRTIIAGAIGASLLAGCASRGPHPAVADVPAAPAVAAPAWTTFVRPPDLAGLAALPRRFAAARAAIPSRFAARLKAEGPLLDPAAAQPMPQLPPGSYRCRLVRLGGRAGLQAFAPDFCYVAPDGERIAFTKQTGSNLPEGYVYPDSATAQVFLGTLRSAGEKGGKAYGTDPASDLVGLVDRVAPFRWRLLLSRAGRGAAIDLYELVPVPPETPAATATRGGPPSRTQPS